MPIKIRLDTRFSIHFIIIDLELGYPLVDRLSFIFRGAPGRIRTPDPLIRSQVLYPAELPVHDIFILYGFTNMQYLKKQIKLLFKII